MTGNEQKDLVPTEDQEQAVVVQWLELHHSDEAERAIAQEEAEEDAQPRV